MNSAERSQKLLAILRKREQTPEMLKRIARVESELKVPSVVTPPAPAVVEPKKKKVKLIEVEDDGK